LSKNENKCLKDEEKESTDRGEGEEEI